MKTSGLCRRGAVLAALLTLCSSPNLSAADLHWDGTDSTADADGGDGTWNNSATNWDDAATSGTDTAWTANDNANFAGTAGTVTLGEAISVGNMTFDTAGYVITGAPDLTLSSPTTVTANADATISAQMIGGGSLTKTGTGTLFSSAQHGYTGGTTVNGGIFQIDGGGGGTGAIRGTLTINDGGTVQLNTGDAFGWDSSTPGVNTININGTGVLHRIGGTNETLANVAIVMDGGTISSSAAGQHYDLFSGSSSVTVNNAGAIGGRESVISAQMDLRQGTTVFTVNDDAVLRMGAIGQDVTNANFTKNGNGTMLMTGVSAHTGNTLINGGTVSLEAGEHAEVIADASQITVGSGATLAINNTNAINRNASGGAIILDGGTLDHAGGNHAHVGNVTLMNGAAWTATSTGSYASENAIIHGDITVSGTSASTIGPFTAGLGLDGDREFKVADVTGDANTDLTVSAELENPGGIIKTGAGTMRVTTAASHSGQTAVNEGTLVVKTQMRNSSSFTVGANGTLQFGATNIFVGNHGTGVADSRVITVNGGTLVMDSAFDARFGNVTLNDGATWTSDRVLTNYDALLANTDAGAATVAVGGTGASTMNGSGGIHMQGVQNFAIADATGDASADLIVDMILDDAGTVGGTGGINKTGLGTMVLTATNSYTGTTAVAEGTLLVDGSIASSAVSVSGGATLGGSGSIAGGVDTLSATATIAPGSSTGTLNVNTLDVTDGGTFEFELGTSSDLLAIAGALTAGGGLSFEFSDSGGLAESTPYTLFTFASETGLDYGDLNATVLPDGFALDTSFGTNGWSFSGTDLQVQFIPEPSSTLLLLLGLLVPALRRRR